MAKRGGARLGSTLVGIAALALVVVVASRVTSVIILFFISVLLASYLSATTDLVTRSLKLSWGASLIISVVATLLAIVAVGAVVLPAVVSQMRELIAESPAYLARLDALVERFAERYPAFHGLAAASDGRGIVGEVIVDGESFLRKSLVPYLTFGGKVAVELVSVGAMAIYMAADRQRYADGVISLLPPRRRKLATVVFADLANTLKAWIGAQLLAMVVLAALTTAGLWVLRVPFFLAFGVFTGVAAIVPFFGTVTSTLAPTLFVLATGSPVHALLVALLGVVVHLAEANVVAPLIFAQRIKVPPVLTILSILLMASLLGIIGLLVAVPLLASTLVVVRHVLIGEVYGDHDTDEVPAAVLVPTSEVRAIPRISREVST